MGHLQKDCWTRSGNDITGRNSGKRRKHACKNRRKAVSSGIDSDSQKVAALTIQCPIFKDVVVFST